MVKQILFKKKKFLAYVATQIFVMRKCLCINYNVLKIGGYSRNKNTSRPLTVMADRGSVDTYTHISYLLTSYSVYQFPKF